MIFLLDDFSGSGRTYLRTESDGKQLAGKITKFRDQLRSSDRLGKLIHPDDLYVDIVFYIATEQAVDHLRPLLKDLFQEWSGVNFDIHVVHLLDSKVSLDAERDAGFLGLAKTYYDKSAENEHTYKGGTDVRRGFAGCGLPVVLSHNTPNNSMFLLWADPEKHQVRGLFPRIIRHRSDS